MQVDLQRQICLLSSTRSSWRGMQRIFWRKSIFEGETRFCQGQWEEGNLDLDPELTLDECSNEDAVKVGAHFFKSSSDYILAPPGGPEDRRWRMKHPARHYRPRNTKHSETKHSELEIFLRQFDTTPTLLSWTLPITYFFQIVLRLAYHWETPRR